MVKIKKKEKKELKNLFGILSEKEGILMLRNLKILKNKNLQELKKKFKH